MAGKTNGRCTEGCSRPICVVRASYLETVLTVLRMRETIA